MEYNLTSYATDLKAIPSKQKFQKINDVIDFLEEQGMKNLDCHTIAIQNDVNQDIGIFMAEYSRGNVPLMHVFLDVAPSEFLIAATERFGKRCCRQYPGAKIFKEFCTELAAIGT